MLGQIARLVHRAREPAADLNHRAAPHGAQHIQGRLAVQRRLNVDVDRVAFFVAPRSPVQKIVVDDLAVRHAHAVGGGVRVAGRAVMQGVIRRPGRVAGGFLHILFGVGVVHIDIIAADQKLDHGLPAGNLVRGQGANASQGRARVCKIVVLDHVREVPVHI